MKTQSLTTFKAYVEQFLAPTLKKDDIVFMDNASVHMVEGVAEAIEARGAILFYLPAYSPDLNPIKMVFAKLKTLFRKADERSIEASWRRVGTLLEHFTPTECQNYLRHAGYASI